MHISIVSIPSLLNSEIRFRAMERLSSPVIGSTSDSFFRLTMLPEKNSGSVLSSFHFMIPRQCSQVSSPFLS